LGSWGKLPARKSKDKALVPAELKEEARFSEAKGTTEALGIGPVKSTPSAQGDFVFHPAPKPKIETIGPKEYGLPEVESQPQPISQPRHRSGDARQEPPCLVYDPLKPFSLSACSLGKAIIYGQYVGMVLELIDDPYIPKIRVAFPEHAELAMREVLLVVDKKKHSGVLA
jgi:hypothetical protein